jgi:hypothetical protein
LTCLWICALGLGAAEPYADRFVWLSKWGLGRENDVAEVSRLIETASRHGINGVVAPLGLDMLDRQRGDYFRRLKEVQQVCERNHVELIPSVFSVGYGDCFLVHNPNLAEGVLVEDAPFLVKGREARLNASSSVQFTNGGFEDYSENKLSGFTFRDQPNEVSFIDNDIRHSGKASLRLENFTANPYGHGRVVQAVNVQPHRCYRVTIWVKTAGLQPSGIFQVAALAGARQLAPRGFKLSSTADWRKLTMLFNSLNYDKVSLYAGVWGGKAGKVWLDDWSLEEVGPIRVLRRPGTPVVIRNESGTVTYTEGKDYATLREPQLRLWRDDGEAVPLKLLRGSQIQDGARLRVSWYHSMIINKTQVPVCMAEPALYEIMDREIKLLADRLHPRRVMLSMDEVRMAGTCRACQGRNPGELLGECVSRQVAIIRRHLPNAEIYIWSDMFDPNHNAHGNYYLVEGDFTGSWRHVPKDLVMVPWGGVPPEKSLRFFAKQGFRTLGACFYDARDLNQVKAWLPIAQRTPGMRGLMYTTWRQNYSLLPAFGELLMEPPAMTPLALGDTASNLERASRP